MITASSASERPASDLYEGKEIAIEANARTSTRGRIMILASTENRIRHGF